MVFPVRWHVCQLYSLALLTFLLEFLGHSHSAIQFGSICIDTYLRVPAHLPTSPLSHSSMKVKAIFGIGFQFNSIGFRHYVRSFRHVLSRSTFMEFLSLIGSLSLSKSLKETLIFGVPKVSMPSSKLFTSGYFVCQGSQITSTN